MLIISVTHSLCVFMDSLVITVHVCVCVGVIQSLANFKPSQGDNYPLIIRDSGAEESVQDLGGNAN